jgi:hypothetical protein
VTEINPFPDFYADSYSSECSDTIGVGEVKTCTVTNDDIPTNQPSIQINSLTISLDGQETTGVFNITDESESGNAPDGFLILLSSYGVDWSTKIKGNTRELGATCTYEIVDIDGVAGGPGGYTSGDPVQFDEEINIAYRCTVDEFPQGAKTLIGTAYGGIFNRTGREFTYTSTVRIPK